MTPTGKALLHNYGLLYISISTLSKERPGANFKSIEEYDESLGEMAEDEPGVLVRISESGEHKLSSAEDAGISVERGDGVKLKNVSVLEMPEEEFYFFGAFRNGILELQRELPAFVFGLGQVYAYSLFESYIVDVLNDRLCKHPRCMGSKKQANYSDIFAASSKEALVEELVRKEINDIMYLPITGVLEYLRSRLGFKGLGAENDKIVRKISLERNCLVHNNGKASLLLASEFPEEYQAGQSVVFTQDSFSATINALKAMAVAIDREWEMTGRGDR